MLDGEVGLLPGQLAGDAHLFQPRLVRAPAEVVHVVGGRADDVVLVAEEVDAAVAVVVDGMIEIAGRQELRLADLARPRSDHLADGCRSPRSMICSAAFSSSWNIT